MFSIIKQKKLLIIRLGRLFIIILNRFPDKTQLRGVNNVNRT